MTPERKSIILKTGLGLAALLVLTLVGAFVGKRFFTPNQHNPAKHGTVQVRLGPGWTAAERATILSEFPMLERLGPRFEWAPDGDLSAPSPPGPVRGIIRHVVVYRGDWGPAGCRSRGFGAGYYDTVAYTVWVDPVCAPGEALAAVFAHEVGHALGMGHVCRSAGDTTPDARCSPVGYDPHSVMNPGMPEASGLDLSVPPLAPSYKDLEEFNRVMLIRPE